MRFLNLRPPKPTVEEIKEAFESLKGSSVLNSNRLIIIAPTDQENSAVIVKLTDAVILLLDKPLDGGVEELDVEDLMTAEFEVLHPLTVAKLSKLSRCLILDSAQEAKK